MTAPAAVSGLDPDLPAMPLLLDDAALAGRLAQAGERLDRRRYLRWKPGTACVAGLELASGAAFGQAVSLAARPKVTKTRHRAPAGSVVLAEAGSGLLIARAAADRDLPALADLPAAVQRLLPGRPLRYLRTLAYKPQRRWVGMVHGADGTRSVVRAYRRGRAAGAVSRFAAAALAGVGAAGLPDWDRRWGVVASAWVPGDPLDRLVAAGPVPVGTWSELGATLARLHDYRPAAAPGLSKRPAPVTDPGSTLELLVRLHPPFAGQADRVLRRWRAARPAPNPPVFAHGDLSADQVIVGERIRLIDWDRAGLADPAVDLAGLAVAGMPEEAWDEVLAGYGARRPVPGALAWHRAGARLRRTTEPWRTVRPDWVGRAAELLDAAERDLR